MITVPGGRGFYPSRIIHQKIYSNLSSMIFITQVTQHIYFPQITLIFADKSMPKSAGELVLVRNFS